MKKQKKEKITYVLPDVQDYQMAFEKQKKIKKSIPVLKL
jgi:hypothetical protein